MFLFENEITLDNREFLEKYLCGYEYKTSGITYTSLFMWRNINHFSWQMFGRYMCVSGSDNLDPSMGSFFMFPPLTSEGSYDPHDLRETILEAKAYFESKGQEFSIMLVPFHMLDCFRAAFPEGLKIEADRPNFDYVYDAKELAELKGKKFHAKKTHLNYFLNNYTYEYRELHSGQTDEVMSFIEAFNARKNLSDPHERELLELEEDAMRDTFENLEKVGYLTGAIYIDGALQALSVGGRLGRKAVTVHIEKANTEYRGLYQAINNEFVKHMPPNIKYINREEDMGIPGLRKAKLSYNPVKMIEKYTISPKSFF
jgi:hypothetical protein